MGIKGGMGITWLIHGHARVGRNGFRGFACIEWGWG